MSKLRGGSKSKTKTNFLATLPTLKKKRSQINNLTLYLKKLGKEEQTKLSFHRRKGLIKIRITIN